jgi:methylthioribose-1-phosphate isomerase
VTGDAVSIEERGASEVLGYSSIRWVPDNVHVRNPAFDVTPAELITAIITDRGVINVPSAASIRDFDQGMHI